MANSTLCQPDHQKRVSPYMFAIAKNGRFLRHLHIVQNWLSYLWNFDRLIGHRDEVRFFVAVNPVKWDRWLGKCRKRRKQQLRFKRLRSNKAYLHEFSEQIIFMFLLITSQKQRNQNLSHSYCINALLHLLNVWHAIKPLPRVILQEKCQN